MFRLLIECTKNIDTLSINFSDGTSVVTSGSSSSNASENDVTCDEIRDNMYDKCCSKQSTANNETCLKALDIPDVSDRPVKIDENLNGREF